jgi:hypothetical protein
MHGVVAQSALGAVCAAIAILALAAEHAVCAASAFFTGIADGVSRFRGEFLCQAVELLEKPSAVHLCNELFSVHNYLKALLFCFLRSGK